MARSAPRGRVAWFLLTLAAVAACDGKAIRLGDGRDGGVCMTGRVSADEVLWIGDSWVLVPSGSQHTHVRDLARLAQAIGPNDDYVIGAAPATTMAMIANQYTVQEAGATKVKVVIMDGGTWDTIVAMNAGASVTDAVKGAAAAFSQFLAQVAADGTVQHVVYFMLPELAGVPGVTALGPLLAQACLQSTVPCHFIDLQLKVWPGHTDYNTAGPIPVPTEAGAVAIADEIWSVMQQSCIAQ